MKIKLNCPINQWEETIVAAKEVDIGQSVNRVGKYLYDNIDGAYKFKVSRQQYDVYMTVYYQIPELNIVPGREKSYSDIHEMSLNINITYYNEKLRINILDMSKSERTITFMTVDTKNTITPDQLYKLKVRVLNNVKKSLNKLFNGYEFIF